MPGKPDRSSLIPFEDEIVQLRRRRPPVPYAQIAQLLREKYNVTVCRETDIQVRKGEIPRSQGLQLSPGRPRCEKVCISPGTAAARRWPPPCGCRQNTGTAVAW